MDRAAVLNLMYEFDALHETVGNLKNKDFVPASVLDTLDRLLIRLETMQDRQTKLPEVVSITTGKLKGHKAAPGIERFSDENEWGAEYRQETGRGCHQAVMALK